MSKKRFRPQVKAEPKQADYPTIEEVETDRRGFLSRLGLAILGAGTLGAGLAACGDNRSVGSEPDMQQLAGVARSPDLGPDWSVAGGRQAPDSRPQMPDGWEVAGEPPLPDAGPDWQLLGDVEQPDAGTCTPDWGLAGVQRQPDAGEPDWQLGGVARLPDGGK